MQEKLIPESAKTLSVLLHLVLMKIFADVLKFFVPLFFSEMGYNVVRMDYFIYKIRSVFLFSWLF